MAISNPARLARFVWPVLLCSAMTIRIAAGETLYEGLPTGPGLILEDRGGQVYVAVFDAPEAPAGGRDGIVIRGFGAADNWEVWQQGPVQGLQIAPNGDVWLAIGDEILRYPRQEEHGPTKRTASFELQGRAGALSATRWGDIWCAGCAAVRRGDAMFEAAPPSPSGWTVAPCCDDSFGNVWAIAAKGRQRDLAVLNQQSPHGWRRIGLAPEESAGPWAGACADDSGFIWVGLEQSVLRVDPRSETGHRVFPSPFEGKITAIARVANRQVAVGFSDGSVRALTVAAEQEPQWSTVIEGNTGPVQAMRHGRKGGLWLLAGGKLQRLEGLGAAWHEHWDEQPPMPAGNHDHIFARIGDRLYTAGGKTFFGWPAAEWVNLDHVWSYDINEATWRIEPPMLEPGKAYSGIAPLAGELWLLGGLFRAEGGTRATATVEVYDPVRRRFRLGPPLPRPAGQIVALTVDGRLYSIGGDNEDEDPSSEVLSIGVGETDWRRHASAPGPVLQASGCVLDGKIYIAAGRASKCPGLFVYDPGLDQWSQVEHPSQPPSAPLCAAFEGKVWVLGGRGADGGLVESYAYAPASDQWHRGPDIPLPVSWAAAAEVKGGLLIAGGAYKDDRVANFHNTDRVFLLRKAR